MINIISYFLNLITHFNNPYSGKWQNPNLSSFMVHFYLQESLYILEVDNVPEVILFWGFTDLSVPHLCWYLLVWYITPADNELARPVFFSALGDFEIFLSLSCHTSPRKLMWAVIIYYHIFTCILFPCHSQSHKSMLLFLGHTGLWGTWLGTPGIFIILDTPSRYAS